jgi:hypothetical protein
LRGSETGGIIDGVPEGQCGDHTDTWHGHQPPRCLIGFGKAADAIIESGLFTVDTLMDGQKSLNDRMQRMIIVDQLANAMAELAADSAGE